MGAAKGLQCSCIGAVSCLPMNLVWIKNLNSEFCIKCLNLNKRLSAQSDYNLVGPSASSSI